MIEYCGGAILMLLLYITYSYLLLPLRLKKKHTEEFRKQGFKVLELPYKPLSMPYF
jgi:hypothetical protein